MAVEYWTTSTCATCGRDGWNLTYARMRGVSVRVHIVEAIPDPEGVIEAAKGQGVALPFFREADRYYPTISDYCKDPRNGNIG